MSSKLDEFRAKFRVDDLLVFRNDGWSVSVRPGACTLGACVISADTYTESLGAIGPAEAADLAEAVKWFEERVRDTLGARRFNYLALMMVDPHLHFHALPRYDGPREFAGITWNDPAWPKAPDLGIDQGNADALSLIRNALAAEPYSRSASL